MDIMQEKSNARPRRHTLLAAALLAAGVSFAAAPLASAAVRVEIAAPTYGPVIVARVPAAAGGEFRSADGAVVVKIPAGALNRDARLSVIRTRGSGPALGATLAANGPVYRVALSAAGLGGQPTLSRPMTLEFAADSAPTHPEIGETAVFRQGQWRRMMANFYRRADNTAVTLSRFTSASYRPVKRSLQRASGPAVERGRDLYLNNTWGSERLFGTGTFQLQEVANQLTPAMAVDLGLQVDASKLPQPMLDLFMGNDFAAKQAALNDPMAARMLMQLGAVVGVKAQFNDPNDPMRVTELGLTCAVCHVTVTKTPIQLEANQPAVPLPIGMPVFGPPNTTLNAGGLLSASPALPVQRVNRGQIRDATIVELQWPRGSADPRFFPNNPFDDEVVNPTSIPPHWNFIDLAEQGYAATWNGVIQGRPGNDYIAAAAECGIDLVMGANGAFGTNLEQVMRGGAPNNAGITNFEIGNNLPQEFWDRLSFAEIDEPGNEINTQNLRDVQSFLQSIVSPPPGPYDEVRAEAGMKLFFGRANCAACHSSAEGTGAVGRYFTNITANRPEGLLAVGIKTPGLRGLAFTAPYFHDGSAATLRDVVVRYTSNDIPEVPSNLSAEEIDQIVEYLKSL